jgi:hypothetical protein
MKSIFILKITTDQGIGFFNGEFNWAKSLNEAKQFDTYPEAESYLKNLLEQSKIGGFIQIEKYFISA